MNLVSWSRGLASAKRSEDGSGSLPGLEATTARAAAIITFTLSIGLNAAPPDPAPPWQAMDYGPFLTASIEAPHPATNIAFKGIAINLGANFGGDHNEAVIFDTDLLRYSAGWTGDFVALKGVVFDGEHWAYPRLEGQQVFGNPTAPGWANAGSFQDPREHPYGPVPRDWAHWKGLYLHETKVVLSYTVGEMSVLEMPALERLGDVTAFARILNLSPSTADHTVQLLFDPKLRAEVIGLEDLKNIGPDTPAVRSLAVLTPQNRHADPSATTRASDAGLVGRWDFDEPGGNSATDTSGHERTMRLNNVSWTDHGHERTGLEFDGRHFAEIPDADDFAIIDQDFTVAAWINTTADGSILALTTPGDQWVPDGRALFLRDGRLTFDVGWVGTVTAAASVTDGQWHHVAMTWSHSNGSVTLFVDGRPDGTGSLMPRHPLVSPVLRVGFTAPNFPESPWFRGRLDGLRLYGRALEHTEVAALARQTPRNELLAVALIGAPNAARWLTTDDGHVRLHLPASPNPIHCKILLWRGPRAALREFVALVNASTPPIDLVPFTRGGPPRWPQKLITQGTLGTNTGPYAVDTLTEPDPNPWRSWMRFGGLDFFPDGKRAALTTWNGDVWIVSGVDGDLRELTWQRIATGLFQPLGLRIVDNQIYALGRDQITRLHDLNSDGETDFYENFNNDCMVSEHFHEFAVDLKTGPDGNFYYIKCACHGTTAKHPHHGTVMKVSKDGSTLEVVARGLRANNGLGVGPNGELTSIENQGHWMPGNRINWIKPGGWYGYQWAWNPENRTTYDEPLCWMHNFVDRSGGTQLWVPTDAWGPFRDEIITISYGMGHIFLLLKEEIDGQMQGAVTRFPLEFETGVMRGAWHPHNGQLYAAGLYGWAGNKTKAGGFYRIRATGQPVHMVNALHFVRDGVVLGFTDPLDPDSATDPGNYHVTAWNYRWTAEYGSPDFKLNGQEGRDSWPVAAATLANDRRTVFLEIPDVQRVMQLHLAFNLAFADGATVDNFVHGTIHRLASTSGIEALGPNPIARARQEAIKLDHAEAQLVQTLSSAAAHPGQSDLRLSRLPALFVPNHTPPSPYLDAGPFRSRWQGYLKLDLNDDVTFAFEGTGSALLIVNGEPALDAHNHPLGSTLGKPVRLRSGLNRFELEYASPLEGDAEFRLSWSSPRIPPEPVPATAFVHDPEDPDLRQSLLAREGRHLFALHQCARCHQPATPWSPHAMPELGSDAPAFNGIGSRLNAPWIAQWLLDPKSIRPDALMPQLLSGPQATADATDIAAFLATLLETHNPSSTTDPPATATAAERLPQGATLIAEGALSFANLGCVACHTLPGEPTLDADPRVPLHHLSAKWQPPALDTFLRAPAAHFQWTRMPDFKLSTAEASALTAFLLDRTRGGSSSPPAAHQETPLPLGNANRGRELAASLGCFACHTLDNTRDESKAPTLTQLATSTWDRGCLAASPTPRENTPSFSFTDDHQSALRAFARHGFPATLERDSPIEFAERSYLSLQCQACHPRDLETDRLTQLSAFTPAQTNPYDDEDSSTSGSVHLGRPLLTYAGEKLYADWMQRFLDGTLPYKPRPELQGRMPAFPPFAAGLANGFAHQHGYPAQSAPLATPDPQLAEIGRRLTLVEGGFSCIACHNVGPQRALAGKDTATVDFTCIAERLRPSYYWRYVRDPLRLAPSTMMPKFISDDGTTPIKSVYDGDPERQFDAIWHYLDSLRPAPTH